jgi:hypothetical protein
VTVGRGGERLGRNLRLGLGWVATSADRAAAYHAAVDQIRYAAERERRAIRSLEEISGGRSVDPAALLEELGRQEEQAVRALDLAYRQATGAPRPPAPVEREAEAALRALRPALIAGPAEFLEGRGQISGVAGLHPIMAEEVISLVDGERTGLEIYRTVAAQAREAGTHYYGTVEPGAVQRYLENAAGVGLIRLR